MSEITMSEVSTNGSLTPCTLSLFQVWLRGVQLAVRAEAKRIRNLVKLQVDEQMALNEELRSISQQTISYQRKVAGRTRWFEGKCLGALLRFPQVRTLVNSVGLKEYANVFLRKQEVLRRIQDLETQIKAVKESKTNNNAAYLEADQIWNNRPNFESYARRQYDKLLREPLISGVFLKGDWLVIQTKELRCYANIGNDLEVIRLGRMQISSRPGVLEVRNLTFRPKALDSEGVERTWEAPHIRSDQACFKGRRDDLEILRGNIYLCVSNQLSALQYANMDGWGVPVMRLFPRVLNFEYEQSP